MGVGPNYRRNNPYTHSDASYNAMQDGLNAKIKKLEAIIAQNPNPSNYEILDVHQEGNFMVLRVKYPNCTNAEGVKIMVIKGTPIDLLKRKTLDPHFGYNNCPLARFEPTDFGWNLAITCARFLSQNNNE